MEVENNDQRPSFKALLLACQVCEMTFDNKELITHLFSLGRQKMLGVPLMRERLDMDTLELVRLVPSKANFNQKYVKTKTKLL